MKELKLSMTLALGAGIFLLATGAAKAQAPEQSQSQPQAAPQTQAPADEQKPTEHAKLNLTDEQKAQIKKIHEDAKSQVEAVRSDSTLSPEQKAAKIKEIRSGAHKQMSGLLTPEQRKAMRHRHHARRMERQRPVG